MLFYKPFELREFLVVFNESEPVKHLVLEHVPVVVQRWLWLARVLPPADLVTNRKGEGRSQVWWYQGSWVGHL